MITGAGFRWVRRVGLGFLTLLVAAPLYAMAQTAFLPLRDVQEPFRWAPRHVSLTAFSAMWQTIPLGEYFRNSLIVSVIATALAVAVAIPAAYALARFQFVGSRVFTLGILVTQAVSGLLFLLPLFLLFSEIQRQIGLRLIGSYAGLVLTCMTFALPFSISMLANYFSTLPFDVEEAACDAGAGPVTVLTRIVIPQASAGIAAVTVFAFSLAWGEVLFASVLTNNATMTLAPGLSSYASDTGAYWNQLMAAALLSAVPVVVVFVRLRRYLVLGIDPVTIDRLRN